MNFQLAIFADIPITVVAAVVVVVLILLLVLRRNGKRQAKLASALTSGAHGSAELRDIADDKLTNVLVENPELIEKMVSRQGGTPEEVAAVHHLTEVPLKERRELVEDAATSQEQDTIGGDHEHKHGHDEHAHDEHGHRPTDTDNDADKPA